SRTVIPAGIPCARPAPTSPRNASPDPLAAEPSVSPGNHRAVIFDLDGVLTDTAEFHYLGWQRLADEAGIAFDRAANEALRGVSRRDSLLQLLGDRVVDEATFAAMMDRKNRYYLEYLQEMSPRDTLAGAVPLVVDAKRRGLKVA